MSGAYLLIEHGYGEGCDHTIGCNLRVTRLVAKDYADLMQTVDIHMMPNYNEQYEPQESRIRSVWQNNKSERGIARVELYRIDETYEVEAYLTAKIEERIATLRADKVAMTEAAERAQYELLKQKYGP